MALNPLLKKKIMHICKRTICVALLCGMCFPSATLHTVAGQQPEGDVDACASPAISGVAALGT